MNVGYLLIFVGSFEMIVIFVRIITETKIYMKKNSSPTLTMILYNRCEIQASRSGC